MPWGEDLSIVSLVSKVNRIQSSLEFRVQSLESRNQSLEFRVQSLESGNYRLKLELIFCNFKSRV